MSYNALATRTDSPGVSSRAASPIPQLLKQNHDATLMNDKAYRRYAATLEKTLATWEIAPEEWADYIAFLSRLLKAIQSGASGAATLPHTDAVASKLAQCLNPGLPSGVHSKALEVYAYIFASFGKDYVASQIHEYLPGLLPLLTFTALSVRPALYDLLEEYVVCLEPSQLRPVLKSFILSILPALEDENSEDFDRALATIIKLEELFAYSQDEGDLSSFYWQSIFLSVITSSSRRQGALNYLSRRLPRFIRAKDKENVFSAQIEAIVSPEPGLLVRAFSCGLADSQLLVQRGFLDLLTTHLPLDSPLLQERVSANDFQLLITSALSVLLRRDMSLNRRVWQWLLGPEGKEEDNEQQAERHLRYITKYGLSRVEQCLLTAFAADTRQLSEQVKPYRIALSLMDRWEIGGSVIPKIFLPALESAYRYSQLANHAERAEFKKSVSLFFDGVESHLIWSRLLLLVQSALNEKRTSDKLRLLSWILSNYNVREEEMALVHAPLLALYTLESLQSASDGHIDNSWFDLMESLIAVASTKGNDSSEQQSASATVQQDVLHCIHEYYKTDTAQPPFASSTIRSLLTHTAGKIVLVSMRQATTPQVLRSTTIFTQLLQKFSSIEDTLVQQVLYQAAEYVNISKFSFHAVVSASNILHAILGLPQGTKLPNRAAIMRVEASMTPALLHHISPMRSKYGVEAVKLLWRLHAVLESECSVQASIQTLVTDSDPHTRRDSIGTFLNLWNLSMGASSGTPKSPMPGSLRRTSSSTIAVMNESTTTRSRALSSSLMTVLDSLQDALDPAYDEVVTWLNASAHTESALIILFEHLRDALNPSRTHRPVRDIVRTERAQQDGSRALRYALGQFDSVLRHAQPPLWTVLCSCQLPGSRPPTKHAALEALIEQCLMLLPGDNAYDANIHDLAASILDRILSGPSSIRTSIHVPELGTTICQRLLDHLNSDTVTIQTRLLDLSIKAFLWQQTTAQPILLPARTLAHARKMSMPGTIADVPEDGPPSSSALPNELLFQLMKAGLASTKYAPYLDTWIHLIEEFLPTIGTSINTLLIPLTEVICAQITATFEYILAIFSGQEVKDIYAPETTIIKLLDCSELFLQAAHHSLLQDESKDEAGQAETGSTVLATITPNMFRSQGPPSKTAKANNRLTAVLAGKDIVRVCAKIWLWTNSNPEGTNVDRQSAGGILHMAQRLKTRTRHMLEQLFALEPLESLEVIITEWLKADNAAQQESVISVLHVLRDIRPKNTVPAILDALCSRTNPALLTPSRQSSLTSDLASTEITLFYSAYLDSLEDDALEEVWSDCTAFLRDVLSNPLPHRQILPALIWVVFQLAQKLENTNYGERKRMKRELGDNFQRLLAATFAALPSGSSEVVAGNDVETSFARGLQDMNLTVILREVIGRADLILETSDRVALCINTVSTNLITSNLKSKSFPSRVSADTLALILRVAKKSPAGRIWRKDVADAFNDPRFVGVPPTTVEAFWMPVLHQWSLNDKERFTELIGRLYAPTSAGIMFGVGASAARLDADRKTQLNIRRIALLLLAAPVDSHVEHLKVLQEKTVELSEASVTSSPSSAVKAELFMLLRTLLLSISAVHIAPLWPIINSSLRAALLSLNDENAPQNNLSLLQACKLLDLLAATAPDDFQLIEWIYLTNTTDAVYHQDGWSAFALSDNLGSSQTGNGIEEDAERETTLQPVVTQTDGLRSPSLVRGAGYDTEDIKAMSREIFVNTALRPMLSQMSISIYESRYKLDKVDMAAFRHALIEDLQDGATVVSN